MPGDKISGGAPSLGIPEVTKIEKFPLAKLYPGLSGEEATFSDNFLRSRAVESVFDLKQFNFQRKLDGRGKLELLKKLGALNYIEGEFSGGILKYKIKKIPMPEVALKVVGEIPIEDSVKSKSSEVPNNKRVLVLEAIRETISGEFTIVDIAEKTDLTESYVSSLVHILITTNRVERVKKGSYKVISLDGFAFLPPKKRGGYSPRIAQIEAEEKKEESTEQSLRLTEMYPGLTLAQAEFWDDFLKRYGSEPDYTFESSGLKSEGREILLKNLEDFGYIKKIKSRAGHTVNSGVAQYKVIKNPRIKT